MRHHAVDGLWAEVTYLAYHLHWGIDPLLDLEHDDRRRLVQEVAGLNARSWEEVRSGGRPVPGPAVPGPLPR